MKRNKNLKENNIEEVTKSMNDFLEDLIKNMDNEIKNQEKLINSIEKFNKCNFDIEDKRFIVHNILANLVEDNEKNIDIIQELVNIIREAINEIDRKEKKTPEMIKLKKILLKYKIDGIYV